MSQPGDALAPETLPVQPAAPIDPLVELVVTATALFYLAEKDENPRVESYWDAFHYVASAVSVGYANLFPVTAMGKLIGGMVMMLGPSLATRFGRMAISTPPRTPSPDR